MIGIRHEDKSKWEARVPLVPDDIHRLHSEHGIDFVVQSSPTRVIPEDRFRQAGAKVSPGLAACPIIIGVKEVPKDLLEPGKTYVFFSHVIKGQAYNMPMLRRLMDLGCTLVDYEKIVDAQGRRLVFFGRFAGLAGMIDTLWALGQRLRHEGIDSPFADVQRAFKYGDLAHAKDALAEIGAAIQRGGLPPAIRPFVCGFTGYGNVSQGAQEIFDRLPIKEITPEELLGLDEQGARRSGRIAGADPASTCYKVVFREEHMVRRADAAEPFSLQEYYQHPERYRANFFQYVPHLTLLVNCIYWEAKYPRLITLEQLRNLFARSPRPRLRVIGDVSCDINGSIECTVKATEPGEPVFVYEPATGQARDGVAGDGPVIMAVDILPCELPVDSSNYFSHTLSPFVPALAKADYTGTLNKSGLPPELQRATILWRGELTPPFQYLAQHVK